jgi:hypothetical protein
LRQFRKFFSEKPLENEDIYIDIRIHFRSSFKDQAFECVLGCVASPWLRIHQTRVFKFPRQLFHVLTWESLRTATLPGLAASWWQRHFRFST